MIYASRINRRLGWQGHLWQYRYFSSVLSERYFWNAVKYVENNPVKAKMVSHAAQYKWSSASRNTNRGKESSHLILNAYYSEKFAELGDYQAWFSDELAPEEADRIQTCTKLNFPIGEPAFIETLEQQFSRKFVLRKRGRPTKLKKIEGLG